MNVFKVVLFYRGRAGKFWGIRRCSPPEQLPSVESSCKVVLNFNTDNKIYLRMIKKTEIQAHVCLIDVKTCPRMCGLKIFIKNLFRDPHFLLLNSCIQALKKECGIEPFEQLVPISFLIPCLLSSASEL